MTVTTHQVQHSPIPFTAEDCPFCERPTEGRLIETGALAFAVWDRYPVSPGHALVLPFRHVVNGWDGLTVEEQYEILGLIDVVTEEVNELHNPDGYNLGVNSGAAAGQTVNHTHLHVIPRYNGDVEDPRGGVRNIIPGKGAYP
jgi:ATP adenylyltransferase